MFDKQIEQCRHGMGQWNNGTLYNVGSLQAGEISMSVAIMSSKKERASSLLGFQEVHSENRKSAF